jgi:hypothetical protein
MNMASKHQQIIGWWADYEHDYGIDVESALRVLFSHVLPSGKVGPRVKGFSDVRTEVHGKRVWVMVFGTPFFWSEMGQVLPVLTNRNWREMGR